MITTQERAARKFLWRAIDEARSRDIQLVLVGSYARGTSTHAISDVDLVMIDGDAFDEVPTGLHLVRMSRDDLTERVAAGDDFAQWALRYGTALTRKNEWSRLADELLDGAPWPRVERKLKQLQKRFELFADLLEMGDLDAAREEASSALNLTARALLLQARHFPLSSPELPDQLRAIGEHKLAEMLEWLRSDPEQSTTRLERINTLVRSKLNSLLAATRQGADTQPSSRSA